jgi:hypothetical protein
MNGNWYLGGMLLMALTLPRSVVAGDVARVAWHSDVENAWKATQENGRPLLIFVTRENCYHCTQMKDRTYGNPAVAGTINRSYVPLVLDGGSNSPLLKELNVTAYPCTFVVSPQAVVLDRIVGYVAPEALSGRLNSLRPVMPVAKVAKVPEDP